MQTITDYLTMGGYAAFIWPAYGVAAAVIIAFAIDSWQRVKRAEAALRKLEVAEENAPRRNREPAQAASSDQSRAQP